MSNSIATYDIDGVIFMGFDRPGLYPGAKDIIITGRSNQEMKETLEMLNEKGINNVVYFNPLPYEQKTRQTSGEHKAKTIRMLLDRGENIVQHVEDDEIQAAIIEQACPEIVVIRVVHDLVNKENQRHIK